MNNMHHIYVISEFSNLQCFIRNRSSHHLFCVTICHQEKNGWNENVNINFCSARILCTSLQLRRITKFSCLVVESWNVSRCLKRWALISLSHGTNSAAIWKYNKISAISRLGENYDHIIDQLSFQTECANIWEASNTGFLTVYGCTIDCL
jgi:hypothetical protein